jgi:hypothetical protein
MRTMTILLLAGVATGANAQVGAGLAPLRTNYTSAIDESNKAGNRYLKERGVECLIRRSDRSRVCHTRAEWRLIAKQPGRTAR